MRPSPEVIPPRTCILHLSYEKTSRYTYIDHDEGIWHGTALVVLRGDDSHPPQLRLSGGEVEEQPNPVALLSENGHTFWRWPIAVRLHDKEREVQYTISPDEGGEGVEKQEEWERTLEGNDEAAFWVPGRDDSMRIMFYSCNGLALLPISSASQVDTDFLVVCSYDTDANPDDFAGPALWRDVLRSALCSFLDTPAVLTRLRSS